MIRFTCNECDTKHSQEDTALVIELVSSDERQMGTESEYLGLLEFQCKVCKNNIAIEFNFWEYPVGALNYKEYKEEGCVVIEEPDYKQFLSGQKHYEE